MATQAGCRTADLEPIDRLEEKIKLLVEHGDAAARGAGAGGDENARLSREIDALRGAIWPTPRRRARRSTRCARSATPSVTRVTDMLEQLEHSESCECPDCSIESPSPSGCTDAASSPSKSTASGIRSGARSMPKYVARARRATSTRRCAPPSDRAPTGDRRSVWRSSRRSTSPTSCSARASDEQQSQAAASGALERARPRRALERLGRRRALSAS